MPDNEELILKVLSQLPMNKWNTYASKKLQEIQLDAIPEELRNFRITGFNEIKDKLNQHFSNDIKYFGSFFDNAEYDRFLREITLQLINLAHDINTHQLRHETYQMTFEVGCAVLAYLDHDVMEPWFDIDELKNCFSGYAIPTIPLAARRAAFEKEACTVLQKSAEESLLNPPLAARIRSKRMRNQPQNTKRRHGEEKKLWQERIEKEEKIDAKFKIWLEKRREERKEVEEKQKKRSKVLL